MEEILDNHYKLHYKNKFVAICGIDGAGKSTLHNMLMNEYSSSFTFSKKNTSINSNLLLKYHEIKKRNDKAWIQGSFAVANAYCCATDFLNYYDSNLAMASHDNKIVISDRYKLCYLAYARAINRNVYMHVQKMLFNIPDPIHTFYIQASLDTIIHRLNERKDKTDSENLVTLSKCKDSYETIIKENDNSNNNITIIDNNGDITKAYNEIIDKLKSIHII